MDGAESHEMELLGVDEAGQEEWFCPSCGRHFLMSWPPNFARTVLSPGDEAITHVGGKGGLEMAISVVAGAEPHAADPAPEAAPLDISQHVESLWRSALAKIELEGGPDDPAPERDES